MLTRDDERTDDRMHVDLLGDGAALDSHAYDAFASDPRREAAEAMQQTLWQV